MLVSESKNISLTKFLKLKDSASALRLNPMFFTNSASRKLGIANPLVEWDWTSMMKYSSLGHFSAVGSGSMDSTSSTSKGWPYTLFMASQQVASPIELDMKLRRSMLSFLDFSVDISPMRCSTCFCRGVWRRGINSSFETSWVGTGESTPFRVSGAPLRIHMIFLL